MIPKKAKAGGRTTGLLYYLYGPGRANEHTDPHMVAAWDAGVADPALDSGSTITTLGMLLDAPVMMLDGPQPAQHVYHVPVRLDPGDRMLTDVEWAEVAREIMDASGIAPKGDPMAARWVAIRHADDHIHIVATMARQDGRAPDVRRDMPKMQARARELERRFGLRQLTSGDKTASRWPTAAEQAKAKRKGREETPRETLQQTIRRAAAGAHSDDEFFAAITSAGLRLNKRVAPDGAVTGYSVALPGDRTAGGRAVWFSGSRLAPDLSLPRVRERWSAGASSHTSPGVGTVPSRAAAWQLAAEHVHQAAAVLGQAGNEAGAGEMVALADFLATYAAQAPEAVRDELRTAARAFERAGRAPTSRRMDSEASAHLRSATQLLVTGASAIASGGEAAAAIAILVAVALAITAAMRWHQAAQHAAQERAAAQAGTHLRAATEVAYGAAGGSRRPGRGSRAAWQRTAMDPDGPALVEAYAPVVRAALPDLAETVLGEAAWPALAATLRQAENAGYDPGQVLARVASLRGFDDADSTAEVLVWRLQRQMDSDTRNASTGDGPTIPPQQQPTPATPQAGGKPVRWTISHSEFVNEADRTIVDAEGTGYLPEGVTAEAYAAERLQEYVATMRKGDPSRYAVSVRDAETQRGNRLAYLPEGSVTARPPRTSDVSSSDSDGTADSGARTSPPPVMGQEPVAIEETPLGVVATATTFGEAVRQAVPEYAASVLADPAAPTLAAYLIKAAGEGHEPVQILAEVVASRDLADADNVAQVLTWRMQGRLQKAGVPASLPRIPRRTGPARPQGVAPGERSAAERAAQEAAQRRNTTRGPRR
ncbi:relaxase/mobilization nuclease domain-containing protein [Streptomyces sp. NPDC012746]|uniref:relaxase/mobilization nuclease domain-containing protein n=1 Tax=Streptomyces sp. NPDC012746 TaxID=3364845 RepID=UPI0036A678B1